MNTADGPALSGLEDQPNEVDRIDLATGASEAWLYRPLTAMRVWMTDGSGRPIVSVEAGAVKDGIAMRSGRGELVRLDGPSQATEIHRGAPDDLRPGSVDEHGVWLGGRSGVFPLKSNGTLVQVSAAAAIPAGGCH